MCEGIDPGCDGPVLCEFIHRGISSIAEGYRERTIRLGVQSLTSMVTTFIGTCLRHHTEENKRLDYVRSGLYGAKQELLARYAQPNAFEKYILDMNLPTEDDQKFVEEFWISIHYGFESALKPFYDMTDRLLCPVEVSMKMYWTEEEPAHYAEGTHLPFLNRMERLESILKVWVSDEMNIKLRFKNILRRFLRFKFRVYYTAKMFEDVCNTMAAEQVYKTARAHWESLPGTSMAQGQD